MWFFQQKELNKDGSLFIKIIAVSLAFHVIIILALLLGDFFSCGQKLMLGKSGALVSMGSSRLKGKQTAVPVAASSGTSRVESSVAEPAPEVSLKPVEHAQKSVTESLPALNKKQEGLVRKNENSLKKEQKSDLPLFSKLEKKYTTLKKKQQAKLEKKPDSLVKEPILPKQEAVKKPEVPEKGLLANVVQQEVPGISDGLGAQRLEFHSDEPGQTDNGVVHEIQRHYKRPPGFDDHESFVITFEIKNGKATTISPKGSEPLAIYSAIKDALLKANFAVTKYAVKKELLVSSGG